MDPFKEYMVDNIDFINTLKAEYYNNPDLVKQNLSKSLYEITIGHSRQKDTPTGPYNSYWKDHVDLYTYLNEISYPRDPDYVINYTGMRYYSTGCFSALHLDQHASADDAEDQVTNVILIDRSDDIIGGITVIAGDSFGYDPEEPNKVGDLRERLITRNLCVPGEAVSWNRHLVHGISRIEQGSRLVFVCTKVHRSKYE